MMAPRKPQPAAIPSAYGSLPPLSIQKLTPEQQAMARARANAPAPVVTGQERTLLPMAPGVVPAGQQAPRLSAMPRDPYADLQQSVSPRRGAPPRDPSAAPSQPRTAAPWQNFQMPTNVSSGLNAVAQALFDRKRDQGAFPAAPGGNTPGKFLTGLFGLGGKRGLY